MTALTGNSGLVALLGTQDGGAPAIYYARKSETPPVYAQVTFRESVLDSAQGFWSEFNNDQVYYDFEVWTDQRGSGIIDAIRAEIDRTLSRTRLTLPDPSLNYMYWMKRMPGSSPSNYDGALKAWWGMFRYRALVASV